MDVGGGFQLTIDKIKELKKGKARGVMVYGSLDGCPYCQRFDPDWEKECQSCPKGVVTIKVMMEEIPEHHPLFGSKPRMYPAVYGFVRGKNGRVRRMDYSQDRDRLHEIMSEIANGHSVEPSEGSVEELYDETPSTEIMDSQFVSMMEDDGSLDEEGGEEKTPESPKKSTRRTKKRAKKTESPSTSRKRLQRRKRTHKRHRKH